jgi:DhnA family fructose-bisphosphate aldolase class Ia
MKGNLTISNRSNMDWGLQNRISQIIKPQNNRALMFAVDH